ncbi:MAG: hypothetical protein AB1451_12695 [Nitrospirota bacterium]
MIRILFHPLVLGLLVLAAVGLWLWARRVNLRVRLTRPPTRQEWAVITMLAQLLRWLFRFRF